MDTKVWQPPGGAGENATDHCLEPSQEAQPCWPLDFGLGLQNYERIFFCLKSPMCSVTWSCLTLCDPKDCSPPGSSLCRILQARLLEWIAMPSPGILPSPGIEPASPVSPSLQEDSLPAEPLGKPLSHLIWGVFCFFFFFQEISRERTHFLIHWESPSGPLLLSCLSRWEITLTSCGSV